MENQKTTMQLKRNLIVQRKLLYFKYDHLPEYLQERSKIFHDAAHQMVEMEPYDVGEAILALNNLIAAKDAFVRSFIEG